MGKGFFLWTANEFPVVPQFGRCPEKNPLDRDNFGEAKSTDFIAKTTHLVQPKMSRLRGVVHKGFFLDTSRIEGKPGIR